MRVARSTEPRSPDPAPSHGRIPPSWNDIADLAVASAAAPMAAVAMATLPVGDGWRLALTLPALFFAPGYLLIQALVVPRRALRTRAVHALLAVGISPALVGLLALGTVIVPGGFRAANIVGAVTIACTLLAVVALVRRLYVSRARPDAATARADAT